MPRCDHSTCIMRRNVTESAYWHWIQPVSVAVLFYIGAKLSLAFAVMPEVLVMLWIPNSILLATFMQSHGRHYAVVAGMVIVAEVAADYPTFSLAEAILFGGINLLEVSIAYVMLRRWHFDARFATPTDITKFVLTGPVFSALVSACAAATVYSYFRGAETSFVEVLRVWWFSDGLGLLIVTPCILCFWSPLPRFTEERTSRRWYDVVASAVAASVIIAFIYSHQRTSLGVVVRPFLLIPPVLYVASRFSMRVTTSVVVAVAFIVLHVTKNNQQPFGVLPIRETAIAAQELIFVISTMALSIAALLSQNRRNSRTLEVRVQERTAELSTANDQLQELAITDPLTGILNRRALFELMRREFDREKRYQRFLSLIVFDIDHFKQVNDRYGHLAGDAVLQHVAATTGRVLRSSDVMARYGGEEFVIIAPETSEARALELAERVRLALRATDIAVNGEVVRVTASFGIATLHTDDEEPGEVLRRADGALYAAKAAGRDRVVAAPSRRGVA